LQTHRNLILVHFNHSFASKIEKDQIAHLLTCLAKTVFYYSKSTVPGLNKMWRTFVICAIAASVAGFLCYIITNVWLALSAVALICYIILIITSYLKTADKSRCGCFLNNKSATDGNHLKFWCVILFDKQDKTNAFCSCRSTYKEMVKKHRLEAALVPAAVFEYKDHYQNSSNNSHLPVAARCQIRVSVKGFPIAAVLFAHKRKGV